MRALFNWIRHHNATINAHCREVCLQRDRERQEYYMWRGICK